MRISTVVILLLVAIIAVGECQRRSRRFGNGRRRRIGGVNRGGQRRLTARERQLLNRQGLVNARRRGQGAFRRNNGVGARRNLRNRLNTGNRVRLGNSIGAQNFRNRANYNNIDAAVNRNYNNKFQLAINSENSYNENAAISSRRGNLLQEGSKIAANQDVAAENVLQNENVLNEEAIAQSGLGATAAVDDSLAANNRNRALNDRSINRNNFFFGNNGFRNDGFLQDDLGDFGRPLFR